MASNELRWHPEALEDAEQARDWYGERSRLAAKGFLLALQDGIYSILEAPERWPERRYGCRGYVFPNQYPYTLIYRIGSVVEIVAVAHQKRRPDYWQHR